MSNERALLVAHIKSKFQTFSNPGMVMRASIISSCAHEGMQRRDGSQYFVHPIAVAQNQILTNDFQRASAYLHDVLQKTPLWAEDLSELNMPERVVKTVQSVTPLLSEEYFDTAERTNLDLDGPYVKIADNEDNIDELTTPLNRAIKYPLSIVFHKARIDNKIAPDSKITDFIKSEHCPENLRDAVKYDYLQRWTSHSLPEHTLLNRRL